MSVHACQAGQNLETARLSLSDAVISFLVSRADARELEKPLALTMTGARASAWYATRDAAWFTVTPDSGTGSGSVSVRVQPAGLDPGRYTGSISFHCSEAANSPQRVRISLTVTEPRRGSPSRPRGASRK
jgi:hypothetical protein